MKNILKVLCLQNINERNSYSKLIFQTLVKIVMNNELYELSFNVFNTFFYMNRSHWPSELISNGTDEDDDITSILSVYCHLLIEKHTGKIKKNFFEAKIWSLSSINFFFFRRIYRDRRRFGERYQRTDDWTFPNARST